MEGWRGTNRRGKKMGAGGEEAAGSRGARGPAAWRCTLPTPTPGEPAGRGTSRKGRQGQGDHTRQGRHHAHSTGDEGHQTHGERKGQAIKQTKQNKNKEKIKISWCSESGSRPHAGERLGGGGCQTRREGASRVLLPQGQGGLLLSCRTPHLSLFSPQHGASRGRSGTWRWIPTGPQLTCPHGQHGPNLGPLFSHGHLPPSGLSCDPTSLSPGATVPSIHHLQAASPSPALAFITLFRGVPYVSTPAPKLPGTTNKSFR